MKSALSLSAATLSSVTTLTTSDTAGIYLVQTGYTVGSGHRLYIDDNYKLGYATDLSGYTNYLYPTGIVGSYHETSSAAQCSGRVIQFSGTTASPAYIRVDAYNGVNKTSDFTLRCIANPHSIDKGDLFVRRSDTQIQYEWYTYNGKMWFTWRDFSNSQSTIEGPVISMHTPQAVAMSMNPSYIALAVDGTTTTYSTNAGYVKASSNPIYIGGDPKAGGNYFQGNISKIQYQNFSYQDFSAWTVVNKYSTSSPYADIGIVETGDISDAGFQPYLIEVTETDDNDCDIGYLLSTNSSNVWSYPTEDGTWATSSDGISNYVTLDRLNRALELLTVSYTNFRVRAFFNSRGLDGGGISSGNVYYVDDAEPTEIGHDGTVIYGEVDKIFSRFYDKKLATDSTRVVRVSIQAPGEEFYQPDFTYSWGDGLRGFREIGFPIDSKWVNPLDLVTTSQGHTLSVNIYAGDADYTASQALAVSGYELRIDVKDALANWETPEVSIFKEDGVRPRWNLIDGYSSTSDGPVYVSIIPGSYYMEINGDNGGVFKLTETISADSIVTLQETGATTPDIVGSSVTQILATLDDTTFGTGDTPTLTFQIKDKTTRLSKNLDDYSVYFAMRKAYVTSSLAADRLCTVTNPSDGIAKVQLTSTDTGTAGRFIGELSIESSEETLTVFPRFQIEIVDDLH